MVQPVCPSNTFADAPGTLNACTACTAGSTSAVGSSTCACSAGYGTAGVGATLACTGPCSAPSELHRVTRAWVGWSLILAAHTRICLCPKCRLHGWHIQPDRRLLLRSVPARPPPHPPDAPRPGPRGPLTLAHPSALHASAILAACGINTYSSGLAAACVACPSASTSGASASSCTCNGGYSTAGIASTLACTGTGRSRGRMRTE